MERAFSLSIAGISLAVESDIPISGLDEKCYTPFIGPLPSGRTPPAIPVHVAAIGKDIPELTDDHKLFDGDGAWAMYRDAEGRHVVGYTGRRRRRRRLWQARISDDLDAVDFHYEQALVESGSEAAAIPNPLRRPLDEIVMSYMLARLEGIILHGVGAVVEDKGLILAGRAGSGKAKIARVLSRCDDCRVLSDDRIIVRPAVDSEELRRGARPEKWFNMFGTPWQGDAGIAQNESAPLHAILFLGPGGPNRAVPLPLAAVESHLTPMVNIPWQDPEIAPVVFDFCKRVMASVPAYDLQFKPRRSLVKYLRQFTTTLR